MNCVVEFGNKVYNFSRLSDGEGSWFLGNTMVHLELNHHISRHARSLGLSEPHNFDRFPPKKSKAKAVSVHSSVRSSGKKNTAVKLKLKV